MVTKTLTPEIQTSSPRLFEMLDKRQLSPEWTEIAPLLDVVVDEEAGSYLDRRPLVAKFALESSRIAREFAEYPDYSFDGDFTKFNRRLTNHRLHYESLIGIHEIRGRERSALLLADNLGVYARLYESGEVEASISGDFKRSLIRLRAAILEEVGRELGDIDLLKQAFELNQKIYNDGTISNFKRYKIHARIAQIDTAEYLHRNTRALEGLGLPTTPKSLQAEFYQGLAEICRSVLDEADRGNGEVLYTDVDGLVGEQVLRGYLKERSIEEGEADAFGFSQSMPHHDIASPREELTNTSWRPIGASYDVFMYRRQDGAKAYKLDVKKGTVNGNAKIPPVIRVPLQLNGYTGRVFIEKVYKYSLAMANKNRGDARFDSDDADVINEMHSHFEFEDNLRAKHKNLGGIALSGTLSGAV